MLCLEFLHCALPNSPTISTPSSAFWLNESPHWLTALKTLPIKVNKIVLSPLSPYCAGSNRIKTLISISEMDEIGGKCFALWKITAPLDGAGIVDETSQPITMAILHHFFVQQIAVTTFKCSALVIKRQRGLSVECNLVEAFSSFFFLPPQNYISCAFLILW